TDRVAQVMGNGSHGSTFGGNPLSTRVGCEVLDIVSAPEFLSGVEAKGKKLRAGLETLRGDFPTLISEVRGPGLMIGLELKQDAKGIVPLLQKHGMLAITGSANSLRVYPSLNISDPEIEQALDIFRAAFNDAT
ncbi:MAG: aminotransferase class III-fold pyridoxal phosphate-dependent enzyme, partial [Bdellovibrionales bacterium]|nr:aminotransferase class III-fold pyridoxal phosphate-dependent enzyme [Bdellovibrionales bacterium]